MGYFKKHWRGEFGLAKSYWINCVLFLLPFRILSKADRTGAIDLLLFPIVAPLMVWGFVGVWRSADRCEFETGKTLWPTIAKIVVVIATMLYVLDTLVILSILIRGHR